MVVPICCEYISSEYLSTLCEDQHFMLLFLPQFQQRFDYDHLSRSLPEPKRHLFVDLCVWIDLDPRDSGRVGVGNRREAARSSSRQVRMVTKFAQSNESREDLREREDIHKIRVDRERSKTSTRQAYSTPRVIQHRNNSTINLSVLFFSHYLL